MSLTNTLRLIPLFSQLRNEDLERLATRVREKRFPKNSVILFEDDQSDSLYMILDGQVKVVLTGEDGREVILSTRRNGDFFGEMSLIDEEPRSAHVVAMEDCRLLVLRREDFLAAVRELPGIALGVMRALCSRLRRADSLIGGLILLEVPERVARLLLELAEEVDGQLVAEGITHHTIAQMIGSSRETVSRAMRSLTDRDIVETARKRIVIKNAQALAEVAGGTAARRPARPGPAPGQPSAPGTPAPPLVGASSGAGGLQFGRRSSDR